MGNLSGRSTASRPLYQILSVQVGTELAWMRDSQLPKRYFQDFPLHDHHSLFDSPELPETRLMPKICVDASWEISYCLFFNGRWFGGHQQSEGRRMEDQICPKNVRKQNRFTFVVLLFNLFYQLFIFIQIIFSWIFL